LSLSYDHRVIDGADGARFCKQLVEYIEGVPLSF
jgi:pyruvate/2-oxoglutarate dehydrogenase complex dihydrolipoamide acyltransferase (E2) component